MALLIYALLWLSFGFMHSILTLPFVKNRFTPILGRTYRFAYNIFAAAHFTVVYLIGYALVSQTEFSLFASAPAGTLSKIIQITGFVVIVLALRQYDLGRFSGLTQLRSHAANDTDAIEPLNISGMNKWVRHPLYTGLFLILWGGAISPFGLSTAVFASLYLLIGTHYEERKLTALYGAAYADYKARVPAYFPMRGC